LLNLCRCQIREYPPPQLHLRLACILTGWGVRPAAAAGSTSRAPRATRAPGGECKVGDYACYNQGARVGFCGLLQVLQAVPQSYKGPPGEIAVVDKVLLTSNEDNRFVIKCLVRHTRRPEVHSAHTNTLRCALLTLGPSAARGQSQVALLPPLPHCPLLQDKVNSRHGQKGVLSPLASLFPLVSLSPLASLSPPTPLLLCGCSWGTSSAAGTGRRACAGPSWHRRICPSPRKGCAPTSS